FALGTSHHGAADRVVTDERRVVQGDAGLPDLVQRLADVPRRRSAVARDDGRHTHADEVLRQRPRRDVVRMGMDIDEARREDEAAGIEALARRELSGRDAADTRDLPVADADVADPRRRARTIDNARVDDDEVEWRLLGARRWPRDRSERNGRDDGRAKAPGSLHSPQ